METEDCSTCYPFCFAVIYFLLCSKRVCGGSEEQSLWHSATFSSSGGRAGAKVTHSCLGGKTVGNTMGSLFTLQEKGKGVSHSKEITASSGEGANLCWAGPVWFVTSTKGCDKAQAGCWASHSNPSRADVESWDNERWMGAKLWQWCSGDRKQVPNTSVCRRGQESWGKGVNLCSDPFLFSHERRHRETSATVSLLNFSLCSGSAQRVPLKTLFLSTVDALWKPESQSLPAPAGSSTVCAFCWPLSRRLWPPACQQSHGSDTSHENWHPEPLLPAALPRCARMGGTARARLVAGLVQMNWNNACFGVNSCTNSLPAKQAPLSIQTEQAWWHLQIPAALQTVRIVFGTALTPQKLAYKEEHMLVKKNSKERYEYSKHHSPHTLLLEPKLFANLSCANLTSRHASDTFFLLVVSLALFNHASFFLAQLGAPWWKLPDMAQ